MVVGGDDKIAEIDSSAMHGSYIFPIVSIALYHLLPISGWSGFENRTTWSILVHFFKTTMAPFFDHRSQLEQSVGATIQRTRSNNITKLMLYSRVARGALITYKSALIVGRSFFKFLSSSFRGKTSFRNSLHFIVEKSKQW